MHRLQLDADHRQGLKQLSKYKEYQRRANSIGRAMAWYKTSYIIPLARKPTQSHMPPSNWHVISTTSQECRTGFPFHCSYFHNS